MQQSRFNPGIGGDEPEHGRHVRSDHARAFADAGNRHRVLPQPHLTGCALGPGIGGHDAFGGFGPAAFTHFSQSIVQGRHDFSDRQGFTDDPGGKRQHFLSGDPGLVRQGLAAGQGIAQPLLAGTGVGIAGVDQQVTRRRLCQVASAEHHRGGTELVSGEDTRDLATRRQLEHHHVLAPGFLDAGAGDADTDTGDGVKIG